MTPETKSVIDKLLSGRLWLSIIAGVVFLYAAVHKIMSAEAIASIITAVFTSYFSRNDRKEAGK
ncbi:MAG: hypothetical protein SFH39_00505 [Candidatus Magnetobacterium sp. LHC-1]